MGLPFLIISNVQIERVIFLPEVCIDISKSIIFDE